MENQLIKEVVEKPTVAIDAELSLVEMMVFTSYFENGKEKY